MNVQLADVEKTPDGWVFGFDKMRRFVRHAKRYGIKFFEHSHLFSQWGAEHAPNIYDRNGKRLFGFETDASGKEYVEFIHTHAPDKLLEAKRTATERARAPKPPKNKNYQWTK